MRSDHVSRVWTHLPRLCVLAVVAISFIATIVCVAPIYAQSPANTLPEGPGKDVVAVACSQCHGLKLIVSLRDGPVGWKRFVDDMILRGAQLTPQEADTVAQYLSKNFGPGTSPMQSGLKSGPLPAGDGEKLVESHCVLCHDLGRVTTVARSKEEWNNTVSNMMARAGTNMASQEEILTMASYLAANFGKKSN
jgi:mono/diheme cytochrome c family protein